MTPENRQRFILAGNATFTIVSKKTGIRFTYRVQSENSIHFVEVLTGPGVYTYLGTISKATHYRHGVKSPIDASATSAQAFNWYWCHRCSPMIEFFHAGSCGRCGRKLTVPESIESGLGPECARRVY